MAEKVAAIVEQLSLQNPFNGTDGLADPPRPSEAAIPRDRPSLEQIPFIQQQISTLTYNHLPRTFFCLEKHRPLQSILLTAKEALAEALPIRCLEATFVALHFTQCLRDVDRIPLSFKSEANGNTYHHIVLLLRTRSSPPLYGALGLSRKSTLMHKPMTFRSLFDIVMNYKHEYEVLGHELVDIKLGIAITHDERSRWNPCWRFIALKLSRYCDTAGTSPTEAVDAAPSTVAHRKYSSPSSPFARRPDAQSGEVLFRTSNADGAAAAVTPPSLNLDASSATARGEEHLERSGNGVQCDSQGSAAPHPPRRTPSLGIPTSVLSPNTPHAPVTTASVPPSSPDAAVESYAPLAKVLSNYMRLLPTISEQYYKTISTIDATNRALKLCYMDLDTAERDAGIENQRRLQYIAELQSPLSPEARRVAATRQLRSVKKERASSKPPAGSPSGSPRGDVNGTKRRQVVSNNEGQPIKRRSPASPGLTSGDAKKTPVTTAAAATLQRTRSPRRRFSPTTAGLSIAAAPRSGGAAASAVAVVPLMPPPATLLAPAAAPPSLAAVAAEPCHSLRNPLAFEGTMVKAHSLCSSASAEHAATEGYATPRELRYGDSESLEAPPLTPRNYDARRQTPPYDAFLRTPSSTSDLFSSPTSLINTMTVQPSLSP